MLDAEDVAKFRSRWKGILDTQHMIRSEIATKFCWASGNVDKMLGFEPHQIRSLFPRTRTRRTVAARDFSRAVGRYSDLIEHAAEIGTGHNPKPAIVYKMYGAALTLALGSFDAYIRRLTIEGYLHLFFGDGSPPPGVRNEWERAITAAVKANPGVLIQVARADPENASAMLAAEVFQAHQVRIMIGDFEQCSDVLKTLGLTIDVNEQRSPSNDVDQLLQLTPPIFDAFAQTRHRIVHIGPPPNSHYYCENQEPVRFLGELLDALVTVIERRWLATRSS